VTDDATHPRVIALRAIVSKLSEGADEYARLYKEVRALDKHAPDSAAKRKDLSDRLTKNMLCMMAQAHLIQCRFFDTLADSVGETQTLSLVHDAVKEAHENEDEETGHIHDLIKGHAPWQI
jgi:hypothetical protein